MRIQHNIMAMNAYRNYNNNASALSKNLEKLSSGYKINRAGDDAAGLAISEKMRAQITGLNAASKNVKDGISLVKTAEGAMQEIQDMLNRMDYLATQSANGTYQDEVDREALQKEVNQLKEEINRIADSANFNGIKLLDGSLAGTSSTAATSVGKIEGVDVIDIDATKSKYEMSNVFTAAATTNGDTWSFTVSLTDAEGKATKEVTVEFKNNGTSWTDAEGNEVELGAPASVADAVMNALKKDSTIKDNFTVSNSNNTLVFEAKTAGASSMQVKAISVGNTNDAGVFTPVANDIKKTVNGQDAYQTIDLTSLKIYQGSSVKDADLDTDGTNKLDKATLTINGKKFAIVDRTKLDDTMKAELKAAGIDHFLDMSGGEWTATGATADDLADAAHKISTETGLTSELGKYTTTNGVNSFEADPAATGATANVVLSLKAGSSKTGSGGLTLQIGDTSDSYNQLRVNVGDMHTKALGIANLSIATREDAAEAIQTIKDAINNVSSVRGDLGAYQNRLEHTANNLSVMAENIQDAESTIRDTDVAEEMMSYVKNNILVQSAQAMLAQANQVPQGVLQLLG
ncbi:flagellin [Colidextribacter sp. OB.20]|uniref:flagellin N-terminal helical domain-containing protein n=1 Tax=Colidextribacter sp. OB.20 TaxID=2304568 RepID=UPI00136DCCF7|nr:flagellin [Colidextribacter sp. OB.20]NBI08952.1 flagellin [Colidextribacter sp. OB.20]